MSDLTACYAHYHRLREEMARWLAQTARLDGPGPNRGGEDELNYALAFVPHYLVTGDGAVLERFRALIEDMAAWIQAEGHHGYEKEAEAHHGTEPFALLLPRYLALCPQDERARFLLEDAAHHIGNWVEDVPPWYDYERDRFLSYHLGTHVVREDETGDRAEHFRFVHIALAAWRVLGEELYAEWSLRYGRRRAQAILEDERIPHLSGMTRRGLPELVATRASERSGAPGEHHVAGDPMVPVENLLASGAVYALGDLWDLSGEDVFRDAARRIVAPLIPSLLDPYADPAAAALRHYRLTFGDRSLDEAVRMTVGEMPAPSSGELAMVFPEVWRRREPGVGRRADMIYWGEWSDDGAVRPLAEPSPAALTLAWEMTGDVTFAERALRLASAKLMMARRVLRGGRDHACGATSIAAVAQGHGRNWGTGAVTGCYGPLLLGTREALSRLVPAIEVRRADGEAGLPREVMSLVLPAGEAPGTLIVHNGSDAETRFAWRAGGQGQGGSWNDVQLAPGVSERFRLGVARS